MMIELGKRARSASRQMAAATEEQKNATLLALAKSLPEASGEILSANQKDIADALESGLSPALIDRLTLNSTRLIAAASGLEDIAGLPDPIGEHFDSSTLPNGLKVSKQRVPLGVLGVIYEARPNVTVDVVGLALKTSNVVILRGGSETLRTNLALVEVIRSTLARLGLPPDAVLFVDDPDRARVAELLEMHEYIDMLIPRGGAALHKFCRENSRIPVITGGIGICHLYVDQSADLEASLDVIRNAKIQRPTVCNALDSVLVHRQTAAAFIPRMIAGLRPDGVTFRAHPSALPFIGDDSGLPEGVLPAGPEDFDTEWLSLVLGIKVVQGLEEAVDHVRAHSTGHSDGILTQNDANARRFVSAVDSAVVYVNASTRFTDGGQLGLGAEVAISTQRLHARGPMGLRELTTYKWVVIGDYHVRAS